MPSCELWTKAHGDWFDRVSPQRPASGIVVCFAIGPAAHRPEFTAIGVISFLFYSALAFVILWIGLRWPIRRAFFIALLAGLLVDYLLDFLVARMH